MGSETVTAAKNLRCPQCGYEMWADEFKGTVECSIMFFCPVDGHALDRLDPLGAIEAKQHTGPETFEEFAKQEHVLGVIHAEVPDGDA
jgi:hypothetical protein